MNETKPNLTQPELPHPDEKLLRAPTFMEKYGVIVNSILLLLILIISGTVMYFLMQSNIPLSFF